MAYCGCRSEGQSNETRLRLIRDEPSSHIFTVVSTSCLSSLFHPSHSTLHSLDIMYPRQRTSLANCTTSREIIPLTNAIFVNRCFNWRRAAIPSIKNPSVFPVSACEMDQTQYGCRIDNGQCTCAYGCRSEFRYKTKKECQDALKVTFN